MIKLRPYQEAAKAKVFHAWDIEGYKNILLRMPTGSGKTKTFCQIVIDTLNTHSTAIMVHRKELVSQICLTLAESEIEHNIIASRTDIRGIIKAERRKLKRSFYQPNSKVSVISVDTLNSRKDNYRDWAKGITQVITDEAAHVLKENKWGRAHSLFTNARSLGVTATPERLDRKGLGSHADGIYDVMIEGPDTYWLIKNGFLSKYKIAIPDSDYQNYLKSSSDKSDYSKKAMMEAVKQSHIIGDVVKEYLRHAKGKQAILFGTDIETVHQMEKQFISQGIPAKALDSKCSDKERIENMIDFEEKRIQVLLNVDLFDEGLDVPGIECVIMARPTKSLGKYLQMIGRGLRLAQGKDFAIIIDHVGNIKGSGGDHGLPDQPRKWTLDRIKKRGKKNNFLRICSNFMCNSPFDRALTECPWCGFKAITVSREGGSGRTPPEIVDGDLTLIDPDTLRELTGMAILESPADVGERVTAAVNGAAGLHAMKRQRERIDMQKQLSETIAVYAGKLRDYGYTDRQIHKRFYLDKGMTITEALGLTRADMEALKENLQ